MSLKIYKGFRIETTNLHKILALVKDYRPIVVSRAEDLYVSFLRDTLKNQSLVLADAIHRWEERRSWMRAEKTRDPVVDTEFQLLFIPRSRYTLGVTYTAHTPWHDEWCRTAGVKEYGYWYNADIPEGMPPSEWLQREKAWEVISGLPMAMQGFSIDVTDPHGPQWHKIGSRYYEFTRPAVSVS